MVKLIKSERSQVAACADFLDWYYLGQFNRIVPLFYLTFLKFYDIIKKKIWGALMITTYFNQADIDHACNIIRAKGEEPIIYTS
jgi:hypothetical protein